MPGIQFSSNYSCHARNSAGVDQVTHVIRVISQPPAPSVSLIQVTHNSLNLSLRAHHDGGAPILGEEGFKKKSVYRLRILPFQGRYFIQGNDISLTTN